MADLFLPGDDHYTNSRLFPKKQKVVDYSLIVSFPFEDQEYLFVQWGERVIPTDIKSCLNKLKQIASYPYNDELVITQSKAVISFINMFCTDCKYPPALYNKYFEIFVDEDEEGNFSAYAVNKESSEKYKLINSDNNE